MSDKHLTEHRYEKLTWPEINDAVAGGQVCIVPCSAVEQHGPHLPLDVDMLLSNSVALEAGRQRAEKTLVLPSVSYGYTGHVMDFPGTIHVHYDHFIEYCLDVCKSVAYYGFQRIIIVDGHGSNEHLCEFIARRATLETDALFASTMWTNLTKDKFEEVRESGFGGAAHAGELETSVYLYLEPAKIYMDKAIDHYGGAAGCKGSKFTSVDLTKGWGPIKLVRWTSSATPNGVSGAATLATAEKGEAILNAAVDNLVEFIEEFRSMPAPERVDHREVRPNMPTLPSMD